jgi:hypothetical protein
MAKRTLFLFSDTKRRKHERHSKSNTSFNKGSDNYIKKYRGQGR